MVLVVGGVAVNFVHPLRVALRLHASPSQSEGEGRSTRLFRASPALCFPVALPLWIPAFAKGRDAPPVYFVHPLRCASPLPFPSGFRLSPE